MNSKRETQLYKVAGGCWVAMVSVVSIGLSVKLTFGALASTLPWWPIVMGIVGGIANVAFMVWYVRRGKGSGLGPWMQPDEREERLRLASARASHFVLKAVFWAVIGGAIATERIGISWFQVLLLPELMDSAMFWWLRRSGPGNFPAAVEVRVES